MSTTAMIAFVATLAASSGQAISHNDRFGFMPDPVYDHPFKGEINVHWEDQRTINRDCHIPHGVWVSGCTDVSKVQSGVCSIYLYDNGGLLDEDLIALEYLHERAHCNGMPTEASRAALTQ